MDSVGSPLMNLRDVTMIYRFINSPALTYLSASLFKRSETHSYNTRNKDLLSFPMCRTSASSAASASIIEYLIISLLLKGTRTQFHSSRRV